MREKGQSSAASSETPPPQQQVRPTAAARSRTNHSRRNPAQRSSRRARAVDLGALPSFPSARPPLSPLSLIMCADLKMSTPVVFFDMTIGGAPAGRIEMTLRADVVPKTAEARIPPSPSLSALSSSPLPLSLPPAVNPRAPSLPAELPRSVHGREGLRLQGLGFPPRHHPVHVPGR